VILASGASVILFLVSNLQCLGCCAQDSEHTLKGIVTFFIMLFLVGPAAFLVLIGLDVDNIVSIPNVTDAFYGFAIIIFFGCCYPFFICFLLYFNWRNLLPIEKN